MATSTPGKCEVDSTNLAKSLGYGGKLLLLSQNAKLPNLVLADPFGFYRLTNSSLAVTAINWTGLVGHRDSTLMAA